ncbi:hypothetical protein V6N12_034444 [Hibiscus sabdariffa]|uniref:Uncharacterized protein n=1 Tax=Hibiscus sabdariffa TaxID=183260 RepID=A0ABR2DH63_9ROSI
MDPLGDRSSSHRPIHAHADSMPSLLRPLRCWPPQIHGPALMPDLADEGEKSGSFGVQAQLLGLSKHSRVSYFSWNLIIQSVAMQVKPVKFLSWEIAGEIFPVADDEGWGV